MTVIYANNANVGTATASSTYAGDANHAGSSNAATFTITQATSTVTITCPVIPQPYTGSAETPCAASYFTSDGLSGSSTVAYASNINVGTAFATSTYAGDTNHQGSTNATTFIISAATSSVVISCPISVAYTGSAISPCTASYLTSDGLSGPSSVAYSSNISVGTASASSTYLGDANHTSSSNFATFIIAQATSSVAVSCPASEIYTGIAATPCSASYFTSDGTSGSSTVIYSSNINVGTATASSTYAGDANHQGNTNSMNFSIAQATSSVVIYCPASEIYTGSAITPCTASYLTSDDLSGSTTVTYIANTDVGTATASSNYFGDANHAASSDATTFTIENPVPTTTSILPTSTIAGSSDFTLTVNGANFVSGSVVNWNGSPRTTSFVSSTEITATIVAADVAATGTFPVTVTNPAPGGGTSNSQTFTVTTASNPVPTLMALSSTSTAAGSAGFTLTLTGTGFIPTSGIQLDGFDRGTTFVSSTTLTVDILDSDLAAGGDILITVTNPIPGGGTSNPKTFTVMNPMPTTSSISPTSTPAGSSDFTLTVNGANFISGSVVNFNGDAATTTFISSTTLLAMIPAIDVAATGTVPVTVTNPAPGGGTSNSQTFTVTTVMNPIPTTISLNPTSIIAGSPDFTLTVNGTDFVGSSHIQWNGADQITTFISSTTLTADIPSSSIATAGTASVAVLNPAPGGGTSNSQTFTVAAVVTPNPLPTTVSITPTSIPAGSADFTLTVNGANFISGSVVNFNGDAATTTFISSTTLLAMIPAIDVAATGTFPVTVTNPAPGGGTSNSQTFTVTATANPVPTLSSINPTSTLAGGPDLTLTVLGTNFVSNSVVDFNGVAATTTFASSTQLTAVIPADDVAATGTFPVAVVNPAPGGGTSNSQTFTVIETTNPVPTLISISPTSTTAGRSSLTLIIAGTDFVNDSTVQWNGTDLATTFVSSSTLTALVPAPDLATVGTSSVAVVNPAPGGGTLGSMIFAINAPASSSTAVRFIFANVTSTAVVGSNVTFNVEALNSSGTIDTSFEQGVTLTVSGSGTGGGLVTIIDGVGTSTISDNVAQNVTLGLDDSQSTGLDVGAAENVTFLPDSVAQFTLNHPGNMNVGTRLGYVVNQEDRFGNPVSTASTTVYLYTNSTSTNAAFFDAATGGAPVTSTVISSGSTSTVFWYYDDTFGSRTVTVSDNASAPDGAAGIADASDTFMVAPGAVQFIFANVPANMTSGNRATVNVYAVDSSNTIYPSFAGGVTVTVSGSATGGGLVSLVNGIGTTTIMDAVAETVHLGFRDTQNTGLGISTNAQIVFNPVSVIPVTPSSPSTPSTGGSASPTPVSFGIKPGVTITFSGMAYPGASVNVIRKDLGLQAVPVAQTVAAAKDGSFLVELDNVTRLTGQTYLLSFMDKNGLISQTKAYNVPVQDKLVYGNILAAPTLGFVNASVVAKGKPITITGYATPKATVELFVDGNAAGTITVNDPSGKYSYGIATDDLATGRHAVWAIQKYAESAVEVSGYTNSLSQDELFIDDATNGTLFTKNASGTYRFVPAVTGGTAGVLPVTVSQAYTKQAESDFSNQQSFTVSPLANPKLDLNGDGVVDIGDLSVFLSYLKNLSANLANFHIVDPNVVRTLDFNGDGAVDAIDLNILLAAIQNP